MDDRRKLANGKEIWVIKAGFPDAPVKKWWSEYAFANSLKKYLDRLGYYVVIESRDEWENEAAADVVIVMRGHAEYLPDRRKKDCIYIMWNLSHPSTISELEYNAYDLVCISSRKYAKKMKVQLKVPVRVLPMCADTELFYPSVEDSGEKEYEWVFVGNSRFVKRKSVMWSIEHQIPLKIWGANWEKIIPESQKYVVAQNIPNDELPNLYRKAKVTVDDHYEDMIENGFINTRIVEAFACGLPVISDYADELTDMFGDAVLCYRNEEEFVLQTRRVLEEYDKIKEKVNSVWPIIKEKYSFQTCASQLAEWSKEIRICRNAAERKIKQLVNYTDKKNVLKIRPFYEKSQTYDVKVSVIIPVYNMEKYLSECLESILNQTLREIEVICIDDGSEDSSAQILKKYAEKDQRVSVYMQSNCGLSETRNRGLERSSGEYIYFIDSDDLLEVDALENLYQKSKEEQLDILFFNGITFFESERDKEKNSVFDGYYLRKQTYPDCCTGQEMFVMMRKAKEYRVSVVMQFFSRNFLGSSGLRFYPGILHEDNDFSFRAILQAKRVGYLSHNYYKRRIHGNSIMTKYDGISHVYGYFRAFLNMLSFAENDSFQEEIQKMIYDVLRGVQQNLKKEYSKLNWQEKQVFGMMATSDRIRFENFVQSESNMNGVLWKAQNENKKLNQKLQKTYAEKSEINRKLQITYGEKYDRGLEIKRLEKELNRIKKSRSYKIARIIGFPFRILRKIKRKVTNR